MQILRLQPGQGGYRVLLWTLGALMMLRPIIEEFGTRPWLLPLFTFHCPAGEHLVCQ